MLQAEDADAAGFYLQQGVEKLLKAFLLARGWKLQRIHDLEALLNEARAYDHSLAAYSQASQRITSFYIIERYPFSLDVRLTPLDVTAARDSVRGLIEALLHT